MGIFNRRRQNIHINAVAEGGKGGDAYGEGGRGGRGGDATNYIYLKFSESYRGGSGRGSAMERFDAAVDIAEKIHGVKIRGTDDYLKLFKERFNAKL